MAPPPPYAYAFLCELPSPPLLKKDDETHLSMFHAKYWGVSIDQDESTWVGAHGQLMAIEGSEVVRGCFALDLDSNYFTTSKLWVRRDYLRIYDRCDSHYEHIRNNGHLSPSVVITGQPGIGERYSP